MKLHVIRGILGFKRKYPLYFVGILLLIFIIIVLLCTLGIYHYEKKIERPSEKEIDFFEALKGALFFFLGESALTINTTAGLVISVVLLIGGLATITYIIGKVASFFVYKKLEAKMPKELEKHIVMCNWSSKGDRIIKEIHSPQAAPETDVIVITKKDINEEELRLGLEYEKVYFIRSDPTLHNVLRKARAHLAKSVIILANEESSDPDAETALISLAITKLEQDLTQKPYIVAEVVDHHKIQHLLDAGVNEWICSSDYGLGIIAQCALYRKLSEVYGQLLRYSKETNEIYLIDSSKYPNHFEGKSFKELSEILNDNRDPNNPTILFGVKRDNRIILNPKKGEFDNLKKDDSLIVMSFVKPDLNYCKNQ